MSLEEEVGAAELLGMESEAGRLNVGMVTTAVIMEVVLMGNGTGVLVGAKNGTEVLLVA